MLRAILGVIVAYVVIFILLMTGLQIGWTVLGPEGAFQGETYEVTSTWIVINLVMALIASIVAGLVCALVAKPRSKAPLALVILILVMGAVNAVVQTTRTLEEPPDTRDPNLSMFDAARYAREPLLTLILNPLIGAVGVMIGAKLRGGGKSGADIAPPPTPTEKPATGRPPTAPPPPPGR